MAASRYQKSECLGNSFVRMSEKAFGKKASLFYPFLGEGDAECVS